MREATTMRSSQIGVIALLVALACGPGTAAASAPGPDKGDEMPMQVADVTADSDTVPGRGESRKAAREVLVSSEEVLSTLKAVLAGQDAPSDPMWRSRAGSAVDRDPKLPGQIVEQIIAPSVNAAGRELGVVLLAARGNAQAAVRQVLSAPEVRSDPEYYRFLVQLLSMPKPEAETVDLVFRLRDSEDMMTHRIATTVLGSQIGTLYASGQTGAAANLAKKLQAEFKGSSDVLERASLLESIGRGGLSQTRPFIRGFARAKQPELRIAAAKGMLLDDTTKAVKLLLALSVDSDPEVQSAAVDSLHAHTLSLSEQRTLHRAVMSDRLQPKSDGVLVHLIDKRLVGEARIEALEHLLARHRDGGWVKGHIDNVLAR